MLPPLAVVLADRVLSDRCVCVYGDSSFVLPVTVCVISPSCPGREEPEHRNSSQRGWILVLGQDETASEGVSTDYAWTWD